MNEINTVKRILVTGSRNWTSVSRIADALDHAVDDFARMEKLVCAPILVHGGCKGADLIAAEYWLGRLVEEYPADWDTFGKAAGPIRNQQMVDLGADICLAFPMPDSRGTWDCVRRAREAGIPVKVIEDKD
jgi:hypothetical protein